ncbi:LacI family DNA-binding transcriptional regulator [Microbacterium sp. ASV49]|uniref:LacI family DNA-binding transcriptional regulator n=1 Tax=Microbacterium candidum TaxID=3041922 RepID=A0ABT7MVP7_9MICO|nr:LacI family DNA-binding transcriptional regulator [Microbacterium sp. ASV49]MDL9978529.1 LacI family DNA-binding transcriptional regulator [Microbacterium sp. ASV49]
MGRKRSSIKDVARRAGVSETTVSHTFSGNRAVNPATQARVRAAAAELGYHPDVVASGLRRSRLGVIGLVLRPAVGEHPQQTADVDYFPRFAGAAALASLANGYALMLAPDPTVPGAPVTAYACDGIIVTDPVADDRLIGALRSSRTPYALVGVDVNDPDDAFVIDIATAFITDVVIDYLLGLGCSRLGLVVGTDRIEWNEATEARFVERVPDAVVLRLSEDLDRSGLSAAADSLTGRVDGIYCLTSEHAVGIVPRLLESGVRVPEDVKVVCGSDAESLRSSVPSISSVDLQPEPLGRQAAALVLRQLEPGLEFDAPAPEHGRIIVRQSSE